MLNLSIVSKKIYRSLRFLPWRSWHLRSRSYLTYGLCGLLATLLILGLNTPGGVAQSGLGGQTAGKQQATIEPTLHHLSANKSLSLKTALPPSPASSSTFEPLKANKPQTAPPTSTAAERLLLEQDGELTRGDRVLTSDRSYYDPYEFAGQSGQTVRIELSSSEFDTYLILLDPNGDVLAENDDQATDTTNSVLTVTLPRAGAYVAIVNAYNSQERGRYRLRIVDVSSQPTPAPNPSPNPAPNNTPTPRPAPSTAPTPSNIPLNAPLNLTGTLATLAQADRLYLQGDIRGAERLYRQAKPAFSTTETTDLPERITAAELSPAAQVIWQQAQTAIARDRETEVENLWTQLLSSAPGFIDGQLAIANYLIDANEEDLVVEALEEAATRFPDDAEIARTRVKALRKDRKRLEASIAARQFALANPEHPDAAEFNQLADEYMGNFRRVLRERIALRGLGSVAIGVLTGRTETAIFDGLQLAQLMAMGESGIGSSIANQVKQQTKLVTDEVVLNYINELGQKVAERMGRDEFEYEFNIIEDKGINAFALPGGKVFVNTGAIAAAKTEAELVGLLGHEVAHAVLSHGFQRIVTAQLLNSLSREIPLGQVLGTLVNLDYSRTHERQSDIVGTRVLNTAGYAADGLRNFMMTLGEENNQRVPQYLSTHPAPASRVRYLEELVIRNGYNRYSFEGVERLAQIQRRLGLETRDRAS